MNISPEEAAQALREIDASRLAIRSAFRARRGHFYLWLWGAIWVAFSLLNWHETQKGFVISAWLSIAGVGASFLIAFLQGRQIRSRIDKRYLAVCITIFAFGYLALPIALGPPHTPKMGYALGMLVWMQVYVVSGIWFDNYLLWVGIAVTALILACLLFFPGFFWGCTLLAALALVCTGSYVRYFWR